MAEEGVSRVEHLTSAHIGSVVRVQTENGAFIEGTLRSLSSQAVKSFGTLAKVNFSVEEIANPSVRGGGQDYLKFGTWGNRIARIIEEQEF